MTTTSDDLDFDEIERLYGVTLLGWQREYLRHVVFGGFTRTVISAGRRGGLRTTQRIAFDLLRSHFASEWPADAPPICDRTPDCRASDHFMVCHGVDRVV